MASAAFTAFLLICLYPGNANIDIVFQARQAIGEVPYQNWHPPVVTFFWEMLYRLTGTLGALFVFQAVLYGLSAWLLCLLIQHATGSAWLGLLGLLVPAAPWTLSQSTILWKDTQSALALLCSVLIVFFIRPHQPQSWWLMAPAGLLLIYGITARKNAISALLPIAIYLAWLFIRTLQKRHATATSAVAPDTAARAKRSGTEAVGSGLTGVRGLLRLARVTLVFILVLGGSVVVTERFVDSVRDVEDVGQVSQIMLDDVMFVLPDDELRASGAPAQLIERISTARPVCLAREEPFDAYWNCYGRGETGEAFSPIAHREELRDLWLGTVTAHPVEYLQYRAELFGRYLTFSRLLYWPAEWRGEAERVGLGVPRGRAESLLGLYVRGTNDVVPIVYLPVFWAAVGALVCVWAGVARRITGRWISRGDDRNSVRVPLRAEAATLASSALLYMLAYFPTIPEFHFRYTYWPAVALSTAVVLAAAGQFVAWRAQRSRRRIRRESPIAAR
ncbi:hypothetical protein [Brevibacterium luteolum]|uniref:hypothetical protein n=1 Tax=Brevibacterium luteolum TaxID=199591 RepID=UPI00223C3848|nr:hypothetical protein [Brevibacterium luteolum]MCT1874391.1 hypothetical protein [Brevibacterium luteolum]MCT1891593.1 hypothetical protein [Brevibacterium luteolum]MCT1894044.1 hypothetical protein [Brevibacterium luteolum]MCT1924541.1 hypothetical protein [Brevibacterium luteolum]